VEGGTYNDGEEEGRGEIIEEVEGGMHSGYG
jgi:hypothetical protein